MGSGCIGNKIMSGISAQHQSTDMRMHGQEQKCAACNLDMTTFRAVPSNGRQVRTRTAAMNRRGMHVHGQDTVNKGQHQNPEAERQLSVSCPSASTAEHVILGLDIIATYDTQEGQP